MPLGERLGEFRFTQLVLTLRCFFVYLDGVSRRSTLELATLKIRIIIKNAYLTTQAESSCYQGYSDE